MKTKYMYIVAGMLLIGSILFFACSSKGAEATEASVADAPAQDMAQLPIAEAPAQDMAQLPIAEAPAQDMAQLPIAEAPADAGFKGIEHQISCPESGPKEGVTYWLSSELGIPIFDPNSTGIMYIPNGNAMFINMVVHHVMWQTGITEEKFPQVSMGGGVYVLANVITQVTCSPAR